MNFFKKNFFRPEIIIFAITFALVLSFALYTSHAWEDYYITFRVANNLAEGNGLVFTVGERVHAFTSPFAVLTLGFLSFIMPSDESVLWAFRVFSAAALSAAAVFMYKFGRQVKFSLLPLLLLVFVPILDAKTVDFAINGMEAGLMIFFLSLTLYLMTIPAERSLFWKLGLAWTGLMWVRPDGFIYIGGLILGFLLFFRAGHFGFETRTKLALCYLKAAVVCAIIYAPWIVWAFIYYGTPVPHTIVAKGLMMEGIGDLIGRLFLYPARFATHGPLVFLPSYYREFGGWPSSLGLFGFLMTVLAAFYWLLPFAQVQARAVSLAFFLGHMYLVSIVPFLYPWYLPALAFLGFFVFAHIIQRVLEVSFRSPVLSMSIKILAVAVVIVELGITLASAYQLRIQQRVIENDTRKRAGLWLAENAKKDDTVFLEPLGYIGFYSNLKMYDYLGLSSPEVIAARREFDGQSQGILLALIDTLRPEWLVLRPGEIYRFGLADKDLLEKKYFLAAVFDSSKQVKSYRFLPGRGYLEYDQTFVIFRKADIADL